MTGPRATSDATGARPGRVAWVLLVFVLVGLGLVRWRLRDVPLERDEGEYAYMGQLLLEGVPPYREAGNHKFPGTYIAYAGLMAAFGETPAGIRIGFLLVNAATIVALFVLGRALVGEIGALAAAAAYGVSSLSPGVLGTAAHLTHFVVLPLLVGLALLVRALDRGSAGLVAAAGVWIGLAVVVRQTSLVFVALGALWVVAAGWRQVPPRALALRTLRFLGAAAAPVLLMTLWLWHAGVFPQFWRWTVTQALVYGSQTSLADGWESFQFNTPLVIRPGVLIWGVATAGLARAMWERDARALVLITLLVASCAAVCSGLLFRQHYYVQVLPAVALLFGYAVAFAWDSPASARPRPVSVRAATLLLVLLALAAPLRADADVFFSLPPDAVARRVYGVNPFPESETIARHLREHTASGDRIAILGSEPQILFLAHRRSATDVLYTYPLVEAHGLAHAMQEETAREIEVARPAYVVYVAVPTSWLVRPDSDMFIFQWANQFLARGYRLDGVADILPEGTEWAWGDAASAYHARSPNVVRIFRRRDGDAG